MVSIILMFETGERYKKAMKGASQEGRLVIELQVWSLQKRGLEKLYQFADALPEREKTAPQTTLRKKGGGIFSLSIQRCRFHINRLRSEVDTFRARRLEAAVDERYGIETSKLNLSQLARRMIVSTASNLMMIFGIMLALSQLGISLGPLLAGLGVAGFIIGFALQETFGNFASGLMILLYRPYDVGDLVDVGGVFGKVDKMSLASTSLLTVDNQLIVIPNNKIWGDVIKNITAQDVRRVDMVFGISYSDDIPKAESVLMDILFRFTALLLAAACISSMPSTGLAGGMPEPGPEEQTGGLWQWQQTLYNNDQKSVPDDPSHYTIGFNTDGTLRIRADCNRSGGTYTAEGKSIRVEVTHTTRAMCAPGSLELAFIRDQNAAAVHFSRDGYLYLDLKFDTIFTCLAVILDSYLPMLFTLLLFRFLCLVRLNLKIHNVIVLSR